jgi:hypothetical protein
VVLIIVLNLGVGNGRGSRGQIRDREGDVLNLARLGDGLRVTGGILFEVGLKLGVSWVDLVTEGGGVDDGVVEFDLCGLIDLRCADLVV